jgi:hypothetical protein
MCFWSCFFFVRFSRVDVIVLQNLDTFPMLPVLLALFPRAHYNFAAADSCRFVDGCQADMAPLT